MAEIFSWKQKGGAQGKNTFRTLNAQFGDGYEQVAEDGLNNKVLEWPLTFEGDENEVKPIYDFLKRHAGAKSFLWKPPLEGQQLFRCSEIDIESIGGGIYSLSATFKQTFVP
jgi:phage-related protein